MCTVNVQAVVPRFPTTYLIQESLFSFLHTLAFLQTGSVDKFLIIIRIHTIRCDYFDRSDLLVHGEKTNIHDFVFEQNV